MEGFDLTNGFKWSQLQKFEKLNYLSFNIFELNVYQDKNKWKHKLIPIEISKNESDKVIELLLYKNHCAPIKKFNIFLGDHNENFICRRCWYAYKMENMLTLHQSKCENYDINTFRTSSETHFHWKFLLTGIHYVLG